MSEFQGIPHEEVEQDEEESRKQYFGRFVSAIMNHENKDALIAELQSKHPYTPFSEELKRFIHTQGNVEGFELCDIFTKIQCPHCMKYLMEGLVLVWLRYWSGHHRCNTEIITERELRCLDDPQLHHQEGGEPGGARHGRSEEQRAY